MRSLRGKVAVVGLGETELGIVPHLDSFQLHIQAAQRAIADAGISKASIDGLITCNSGTEPIPWFHAETLAETLRLSPRHCYTGSVGGALPIMLLLQAAAMIDAGVCETILFVMADNLRTSKRSGRAHDIWPDPEYEIPYGASALSLYAMAAQAYMHRYGATAEDFAAVAVTMREHAALNPKAQKRDPITIEDVLASRQIASPLRMLDCSLISDGGAAFVLTSADRAAASPNKPVYLLGVGEGRHQVHLSEAHSLTTSAATLSAQRAFEMAGLTPADVDVAQIYDPFAPIVPIYIEDLGFCPKGEGARFVRDGNIRQGGTLPVNTHGGLLSCAHPGLPGTMLHIAEAIAQLRGTCGARQVPDAGIALVHGQGGTMSTHATALLGVER